MLEPRAKQAGGRGARGLRREGRAARFVRTSGAAHHPHPVVPSSQKTPAPFRRTRGSGGAASGQGLRLRSHRPGDRCGPARAGRGLRRSPGAGPRCFAGTLRDDLPL